MPQMRVRGADELDEARGRGIPQLVRHQAERQRAHVARLGVGDGGAVGVQVGGPPCGADLLGDARVPCRFVVVAEDAMPTRASVAVER